MIDRPHILFAGGGSLGHIYPGLSIAERLIRRAPQARITFVGDGRPIEKHTVRGAGFQYTSIPCGPKPRGLVQAARYAVSSVAGSCASVWLLGELKASLVIGLGGHASSAMLRGAMARRTPTVIVESNCQPTRSTRSLSRTASACCLAYEQTLPHLPVNARAIITGAPGRPQFERGVRRRRSPDGKRVLVVIGGVGGSRTLNESIPESLQRLGGIPDGWRVVHQTGEGQLLETERRYRERGIDALVVTYVDEMADLLSMADLVVSPSGGCLLPELALAGAAGLIVPDTAASEASQTMNAKLAAEAGGCRWVNEQDGNLSHLVATELRDLLANDPLRDKMSQRMSSWAQHGAADRVASVCCDFLVGSAPVAALSRAA